MTRTKQIGIRLTLSNHLELDELAKKINCTKSAVINTMLEQFFSKNEQLIDSILAGNNININDIDYANYQQTHEDEEEDIY